MRCKRCNSLIREHEITIDERIECWKCGAIYELDDAERISLEKAEPLPKGFEILELRSELNIFMKWRDSRNKFIEFFALLWNGILLFMMLIMIASGQYGAILFLSIHLIAGIVLIYYVIGKWVNRTVLTVNESYISTSHKPIPWFFYKAIKYPSRDIDQLYCKKYVSATVNDVPQYSYRVMAQLKNFDEFVLIQGLQKINHALFLEQKVEQYLGIKDRPVDGSMNANIS